MRGLDHVPLALEQLGRDGYEPPAVHVSGRRFDEYDVEDVTVSEYDHKPYIPGRMAV